MSPERSRKRLSLTERREQMLKAAREVFVEYGVHGATARRIAGRAGVTDAYIYQQFSSMDEMFTLAVDVPLRDVTERLHAEISRVAVDGSFERADALLRCHELFLHHMLKIGPLLSATMFARQDAGRAYYVEVIHPSLRRVVETIIVDISGWPLDIFDLDLLAESFLGIHLGIAMEHALVEEQPIDVVVTAQQIAALFAEGMTGTQREYAGKRSNVAANARTASEGG